MRTLAIHAKLTSSMASTAGLLTVASVLGIVFGVVRNKYMATALGPDGIGVLGQLAAYQATAIALIGLGLPGACSRELAKVRGSAGDPLFTQQRILGTAFFTSLILGFVAVLLTYLESDKIAQLIMSGVAGGGLFLRIASSAILFTTLNSLIIGVFQGFRAASQVALVQISASALALVVTIPLVWIWGLQGAIAQLAITAGVVLFVELVLLMRFLGFQDFSFALWRPSRHVLRALLAVGIAATIAMVGDSATLLVTRSWLVEWRGVQENGYAQVAWALSSYYLTIFLGTISVYSFPRANECTDLKEMCKVVNESLHFNLALLVPAVIIVTSMGYFVIHALYTSQFLEAVPALTLKAIGDIFYVTKWCVGLPLIARGRLREYVILNLLDNLAMVVISLAIVQPLGALGLAIAYLGSNIFGATINFIFQYRTLDLRLDTRNLKLGGLFIVITALILPSTVMPLASSTLGVIALGGWLLLVPETTMYLTQAVKGIFSR